ncbi:PUB7 [Symbiodinium natans]|uniref:RING-type E3 ubiquitin transferase n=1 Tax=Symbiodinium natans TaxID=878477 RepID=A0A812SA59_9DINO|nr:PUB7 [Symbiodinium natans]
MPDLQFTSDQVAEALSRLTAVAGEKGLPATETAGSAEDLPARWQAVVAAAAVSPELDPASLEQLRAIYNFIEAVIISCGAPDSFDVYEACFETLTKVGFGLPGIANKELLLKLLEDVHEVYDVLLSCVETYEWVQPGATGLLRLWMLQVLFAIFGENLTGLMLMELTDNDVAGAVSLISFIVRCDQAPFEMQSAAGQCLVQLTTADSVFLSKTDAGGDDWQNEQIAKLTSMLNRHVNGLIQGIIQFDIVEAFGRCICQHQMSHSRTDIIVKYFLTTIHNCLLYCSANQKKLRQHLATQSTIVQDIMIPYVYNILPALFDNPACGPALIEWQNLKATLQTFVVVTFNINVFRPHLRDSDMIPKICEVPRILTHISMLELLVKMAINVDYPKGPYCDKLTQMLQAAFEQLPPESQVRLQRRMTCEQSMRLPFSRSSVKAVELLSFAFGSPEASPEAAAANKSTKQRKWKNAKNKARRRKKLFSMQASNKNGEEPEADDEQGEESEDDMPPLIPGDEWEAHLGTADEAGVPQKAVCQLSGALMHDPVSTPDGYLFERAALEDWTSQHGSNPLTGAPLAMDEVVDREDIANFIQGYQLQMLSVTQVAPEAIDGAVPEVRAAPDPDVPAPPPTKPVETGPSLLGDLPSLSKNDESQNKRKDKHKIRIESRSVVDCPEDMRCAIDGKVMVNPVLSRYGHHFERKTLEKWFGNCGSVCPITQKPLRLEECQPDNEMKKRIVKFLKGQA